MLEAFRILEEDKGIKKEDIIDAVVESLRSAYRRRYGQSDSVAIDFNEKTGDFTVYTVREVVDEVFDSRLEISLKDALAINSAYELGDKIKFEEAPAEFGRVAAQSAKQTIMEKMRKQTRAITYTTYTEHEQEIMSGTVERFDNRFIYVNLGSIEAQLSKQDQIPGWNLLVIFLILAPPRPTIVPIASTFGLWLRTATFVRSPASRATLMISTVPSYTSGISCSIKRLIISG